MPDRLRCAWLSRRSAVRPHEPTLLAFTSLIGATNRSNRGQRTDENYEQISSAELI